MAIYGGGTDITGFTVEIVNETTQWRSGVITLREDGAFMAEVFAEKGSRNIFIIEIKDSTGVPQEVSPNQFTYTIGTAVEEQSLPNTLSIALEDNDTEVCFPKGTGLPAKKALTGLRTTRDLKKGGAGDVLKIVVVEGQNLRADRNQLTGIMVVPATDIARDLPAESEIEVTLIIDASRNITVKVYVNDLDAEFEKRMDLSRKANREHLVINSDCKSELKRLRELRSKAVNTSDATATEALAEVDDSTIKDIEAQMEAAKADKSALGRCEKLLVDLRVQLDKAEDSLEWPALVKEVRNHLELIEEDLEKINHDDFADDYEALRAKVEAIISQKDKDSEQLRKCFKKMKDLGWEVMRLLPETWIAGFNGAVSRKNQMSDPDRADTLINQGLKFIEDNDMDGLRNVVVQLYRMLPKQAQAEIKTGGFGSTIARA